jgi:hypothetical protein
MRARIEPNRLLTGGVTMARAAAAAKARASGAKTSARTTARRVVGTKTRGRDLPDLAGLPPERQIALLKRDRDALIAALDAAEARAATLEARQAEVADRIAWALDTLRELAAARR